MSQSLALPLVVVLTAVLPAQIDLAPPTDLAGPVPSVETGRIDAAEDVAVPQTAKPSGWKSSLNLGAIYNAGNTSLRSANFAADATKKEDRNETSVFAAWNYSEQKNSKTLRWSIDQRRTTGGAKHKLFLSAAERTYVFVTVDAENNLNQSVSLRFTGTAGVGHELIAEKNLKVAAELGAGYFLEQSSTSGVKDAEFATGRAGLDTDWQISSDWKLLNTIKYFFSLEDTREMYGESDTRVRAAMGEGMFAQAQWIVQWDNTPSRKANGTLSDRIDQIFLLSIGWAF